MKKAPRAKGCPVGITYGPSFSDVTPKYVKMVASAPNAVIVATRIVRVVLAIAFHRGGIPTMHRSL